MATQLATPSIALQPRRRRAHLDPEIVLQSERRELKRRRLAAVARLNDVDYELQREDLAKELNRAMVGQLPSLGSRRNLTCDAFNLRQWAPFATALTNEQRGKVNQLGSNGARKRAQR